MAINSSIATTSSDIATALPATFPSASSSSLSSASTQRLTPLFTTSSRLFDKIYEVIKARSFFNLNNPSEFNLLLRKHNFDWIITESFINAIEKELGEKDKLLSLLEKIKQSNLKQLQIQTQSSVKDTLLLNLLLPEMKKFKDLKIKFIESLFSAILISQFTNFGITEITKSINDIYLSTMKRLQFL